MKLDTIYYLAPTTSGFTPRDKKNKIIAATKNIASTPLFEGKKSVNTPNTNKTIPPIK